MPLKIKIFRLNFDRIISVKSIEVKVNNFMSQVDIVDVKIIGGDSQYVIIILYKERGKTMNENMKEVYFNEYCSKCLFKDTPEAEDPCDECLEVGGREFSHKPEKFQEA